MQQPLSRAHPERTAWAVVWSAFAVLCVVAVAVPLGARYVLRYSTRVRPATLQVLEGTARVTNPGTGRLDAVTKDQPMSIGEGIVIQLDEKANALVQFSDGSYVRVRPDSDLTVEQIREPRFGSGVTPYTVALRMSKGELALVTSKATRPAGLDFTLHLQELGTTVALKEDGVYGADVTTEGGEVWTQIGSAVVTGGGRVVRLLAMDQTTLTPGQPPTSPIARAKNLLANGDFRNGLDGWIYYNDQGGDGGNVDGTVTLAGDGGSKAVRFFRTGSSTGDRGNHCETVLEQRVDKALPDPISSLAIKANLKVTSQSLPGGGMQASEYPLIIRMRYRDDIGNENEWVQGFYVGDPRGNPTGTAIQVPGTGGYYFESENLLKTLKPRPARIVWLKVYASGWDYESVLSSISLEVQ